MLKIKNNNLSSKKVSFENVKNLKEQFVIKRGKFWKC